MALLKRDSKIFVPFVVLLIFFSSHGFLSPENVLKRGKCKEKYNCKRTKIGDVKLNSYYNSEKKRLHYFVSFGVNGIVLHGSIFHNSSLDKIALKVRNNLHKRWSYFKTARVCSLAFYTHCIVLSLYLIFLIYMLYIYTYIYILSVTSSL